MRWLAALLLVAFTSGARADASVGRVESLGKPPQPRGPTTPTASEEPTDCRVDASPFARAWLASPERHGSLVQWSEHFSLFADDHASAKFPSVTVRPSSPSARESRELRFAHVGDAALVEHFDGHLIGVLALRPTSPPSGPNRLLQLLAAPMGAPQWKRSSPRVRGDRAATLVLGDTLYVAPFFRNATGSDLFAFDLITGALEWHAEVIQLDVDHSQYENDVTLELRGGQLWLRGYESAGCYVQTFDRATGKRLSARTWGRKR